MRESFVPAPARLSRAGGQPGRLRAQADAGESLRSSSTSQGEVDGATRRLRRAPHPRVSLSMSASSSSTDLYEIETDFLRFPRLIVTLQPSDDEIFSSSE